MAFADSVHFALQSLRSAWISLAYFKCHLAIEIENLKSGCVIEIFEKRLKQNILIFDHEEQKL